MRALGLERSAWVTLALFWIGSSGCVAPAFTDTSSTAGVPSTRGSTTSTTEHLAPVTSGQPSRNPDSTEVGEVLVIGDWGSGTLPQGAVAGAMARYAESAAIEAILTTGDNFYSDDAEFLMKPFDWAAEDDIPFWITWGNHDVESPSRIQTMTSTFPGSDRWDVHLWGRLDVVILDSNQVDSEEQLSYLRERMTGSDRPTIVVFHHPAFSCGDYSGDERITDQWLPVFDDDVVLVLSGHDHNYQRLEVEDIVYVVSGGGGQRLYELESCAEGDHGLIAGASEHHFLVLTQTTSSLTVDVIDVNGERLDAFTVSLP